MLADPHWEPVWNTTEELGLSINFHIGSGDPINVHEGYEGNGQQAYAKRTVRLFMANMNGAMEILISGVCHRHPNLNFVSVTAPTGRRSSGRTMSAWSPPAGCAVNCGWSASRRAARPAVEEARTRRAIPRHEHPSRRAACTD